MKTFESQLLELLREYEEAYELDNGSPSVLRTFRRWLSKRVEKEEEKPYDLKDGFLSSDTDTIAKVLDLQNGKLDKLEAFFYGVPIAIVLREPV